MMRNYYGIDAIPLHDDRAAAILLSTHNRSQATHCKTVLGFKKIADEISRVCHNFLSQLSTMYQILRYLQSITSDALQNSARF